MLPEAAYRARTKSAGDGRSAGGSLLDMSRSTRPRLRLLLLVVTPIATLGALLVAEIALRLLVPPFRPLGDLSYQTETGEPITAAEGVARGRIVPVPPPVPRPRMMFAPDQTFYLCYSDAGVLRRDWFDARGRVAVHINRFGLRDDDDLTPDKPPDERRIVCIGDSFTFGWGVPVELGWVRLLQDALRSDGVRARTVNCGAAGTVCVDEYWCALQHRFHLFRPDAVVMTLCLNDLIPSDGLAVYGPSPATGIRCLDLCLGALGRSPLDLDPKRDWVGELLALAPGDAGPRVGPDKPSDAMWSTGTPQRCMREAKAWCDARGIPFLVVLWPFLQGLGPSRWYPFQRLHDLVAADCLAAGIPFLDVLPQLAGTAQEELWVTPADAHPNPTAHKLATPAIAAFVRRQTGW